MNTERHNHLSELISTVLPLMGMLAVSLLSFTTEQRYYIRERDKKYGIQQNKGGCQFPSPHPCNGDVATNAHHLIPQRYAKEFDIDPDFVENGITLCEYSHTHYIHPDVQTARKNYHVDKKSYQEVFNTRAETLKKGQIYWIDKWDRIMHTIVVKNTQKAAAAGLVPPERKYGRTD